MTLAPAGRPVGTHVALVATLGPLLVQVTVPVTVLPAGALVGKALSAAAISACAVTAVLYGVVLLPGVGSAVVLAAVTVALTVPLTGAT